MKTAESHNAELTGSIHILPMPPIPAEAWKFIEEAQKANERITGASDAKTKLRPDVHVEGDTPSA